MDVSEFSLAELRELERLIPREIKRREVQEKVKLRKDLEAFALSRGFSLGEVISDAPQEKSAGTRSTGRVPPKYRHPSQPDLEWTGRGRKPKWVEAWLANGGDISQLVI